jgi:hypothetical protein
MASAFRPQKRNSRLHQGYGGAGRLDFLRFDLGPAEIRSNTHSRLIIVLVRRRSFSYSLAVYGPRRNKS